MVTIKCNNASCTQPGKKFRWDESAHVTSGGKIVKPHAPGAVRVIVVCPCGTENVVWVTGVKKDDKVYRGQP